MQKYLVYLLIGLSAGCQHAGREQSRVQNSKSAPAKNAAALDADLAAELLSKDGGFTLNASLGNMAGSGYFAVSVFPEYGLKLDHAPDAKEIRLYVETNQALLGLAVNSLGGWCEGERSRPPCFLDISRTTKNRDLALRLGSACNQMSVAYLGSTVEFVNTGGTGTALEGDRLTACKVLRDQID